MVGDGELGNCDSPYQRIGWLRDVFWHRLGHLPRSYLGVHELALDLSGEQMPFKRLV